MGYSKIENRKSKIENINSTLSLIIPCYNCLEYLNSCLFSLEKQTFKNFEVIIVDNGSSDGLSPLLQKTAFSYPVIIHQENQNTGYANGVNTGIAYCTNDIVVVLNSDLTFELQTVCCSLGSAA